MVRGLLVGDSKKTFYDELGKRLDHWGSNASAAESIGIHFNTVSRWINGKTQPKQIYSIYQLGFA